MPVSLQNGIFLHSKSVLMQMEKRMKKKRFLDGKETKTGCIDV